MDWRESLEKLFRDLDNVLSIPATVLRGLTQQVEYNFFLVTNIDLGSTNGKVYFGSDRGRGKFSYSKDDKLVEIETSVTIVLTSMPISLFLQSRGGSFEMQDGKYRITKHTFAFIDGIDPRVVYARYYEFNYKCSYVPVSFDLDVDHLQFESTYIEMYLRSPLAEQTMVIDFMNFVTDYAGPGTIHNSYLKMVCEGYVQFYVDFGSSGGKGIEHLLSQLDAQGGISRIRVSSYPERREIDAGLC